MTAIRSPAVRIAYRSFSMAEVLASDLDNNGQNQAQLPLAAKLHTITAGA
jgi:hypothetical protein